ncbi:ALF repeat-containing protein [Actinacidiphila glaucinigra]
MNPEASSTHLRRGRRGVSPTLRVAANAALDDNTPEALRHFLEVGRSQVT